MSRANSTGEKQVTFSDEIQTHQADSSTLMDSSQVYFITHPFLFDVFCKICRIKTNYCSINNESDTEESNFLDIHDVNERIFSNSYNFSEGLAQETDQFVTNTTECLDYDKIYNLIDLKDKDEVDAVRRLKIKIQKLPFNLHLPYYFTISLFLKSKSHVG